MRPLQWLLCGTAAAWGSECAVQAQTAPSVQLDAVALRSNYSEAEPVLLSIRTYNASSGKEPIGVKVIPGRVAIERKKPSTWERVEREDVLDTMYSAGELFQRGVWLGPGEKRSFTFPLLDPGVIFRPGRYRALVTGHIVSTGTPVTVKQPVEFVVKGHPANRDYALVSGTTVHRYRYLLDEGLKKSIYVGAYVPEERNKHSKAAMSYMMALNKGLSSGLQDLCHMGLAKHHLRIANTFPPGSAESVKAADLAEAELSVCNGLCGSSEHTFYADYIQVLRFQCSLRKAKFTEAEKRLADVKTLYPLGRMGLPGYETICKRLLQRAKREWDFVQRRKK